MKIERLDEMNDTQKIGTSSELSAYEEAIRQNNELLERLKESRKSVEDESLRIIDAMGIAFDQKAQSIETMRAWRKTIEMEAGAATNHVNALMKNVTPERIKMLREVADIAERLNKIDPGLLLGKLFSDV